MQDSKGSFGPNLRNHPNQGLKFHTQSFSTEGKATSDSDNPWNVNLKKREAYQTLGYIPASHASPEKVHTFNVESNHEHSEIIFAQPFESQELIRKIDESI